MGATYHASLPLERDHIRLLIGDTDEANAQLQDEEIDALIADETVAAGARKYYVAARCLEVLKSRYATMSKGLSSKSIGRLSKSWGLPGSSASALDERISSLRRQGAILATPSNRSHHFQVF